MSDGGDIVIGGIESPSDAAELAARTPPVDPQPGPDLLNRIRRTRLALFLELSEPVARDVVETLKEAEAALLRAAETERELRQKLATAHRNEEAWALEANEGRTVLAHHADRARKAEAESEALRASLARAEQDTGRLDWLGEFEQEGSGLVSDDGGRWALTGSGFQSVPEDGLFDISMTFWVEKDQWKESVRAALDAARLAAPQDHQEGESSGD